MYMIFFHNCSMFFCRLMTYWAVKSPWDFGWGPWDGFRQGDWTFERCCRSEDPLGWPPGPKAIEAEIARRSDQNMKI